MMYSEQLKYIRLVKNITSLMIKTQLFFLFIGAYTYSYSLPIWVMFFFQNLLTFLKNYRIANIGCFNLP